MKQKEFKAMVEFSGCDQISIEGEPGYWRLFVWLGSGSTVLETERGGIRVFKSLDSAYAVALDIIDSCHVDKNPRKVVILNSQSL